MGEVDRRPILLLVNPAAGQKRAATRTDRPRSPAELLGGLTTWGLSVELRELGEGEDTTALARAAAKAGRDVVVAGGDGTVGSAASALVGSDATLGIIPLGTFNNIARGAGIPTDLAQALEVIVRGERRAIDVGLAWHVSGPRSQNGAAIGDPPADAATFFEAVGVGLDAEGFGVAEVGERLGWLPAARAAWRVLRRRKTPLWLVIDGKRYRTASPACGWAAWRCFGTSGASRAAGRSASRASARSALVSWWWEASGTRCRRTRTVGRSGSRQSR
ncbi:MAG: hypothetical protein E6I62_03260 [Chloroflexi bacterium]|nr:MAG: hypothetical protein E6I62_03260 [Chloroflexota bacterium]